jgi:hypothetical protein
MVWFQQQVPLGEANMKRNLCVCVWLVACVVTLGLVVDAAAQVNTASLSGTVLDQQGCLCAAPR